MASNLARRAARSAAATTPAEAKTRTSSPGSGQHHEALCARGGPGVHDGHLFLPGVFDGALLREEARCKPGGVVGAAHPP